MIASMVSMGFLAFVAVKLVKHGGGYGSVSLGIMVAVYCSNGVLRCNREYLMLDISWFVHDQ